MLYGNHPLPPRARGDPNPPAGQWPKARARALPRGEGCSFSPATEAPTPPRGKEPGPGRSRSRSRYRRRRRPVAAGTPAVATRGCGSALGPYLREVMAPPSSEQRLRPRTDCPHRRRAPTGRPGHGGRRGNPSL